jgi:hypothetical protein
MATATEDDCEMADAEATEEGNEGGGGGEMDGGAGEAAAQRDDDAEDGSETRSVRYQGLRKKRCQDSDS